MTTLMTADEIAATEQAIANLTTQAARALETSDLNAAQEHMDQAKRLRAALEAQKEIAEEKEREAAAKADRLEKMRNAPEPASYQERRRHLQGVADALEALVGNDTDGPYSHGLKGHVEVFVTPATKREIKITDNLSLTDTWFTPTLQMKHRGDEVYAHLEFFAEQHASNGWRANPTGRMRMRVIGEDGAKSFPPKKDGSYAYDKIAEELRSTLRVKEQEFQDMLKISKNKGSLETLRAKYGFNEYEGTLSATKVVRTGHGARRSVQQYAAPAGQLYLVLNKTVTPEQAEAILDAAIAAGVKL